MTQTLTWSNRVDTTLQVNMRLDLPRSREILPVVIDVDKMAEPQSKTCDILPPTMPNDSQKASTLSKRSNAFVIDWGEPKQTSLQEAFLKFQKDRQDDIRQTKKMKKKKRRMKKDPVRLNALRKKFIDTSKKYFGVPYARKYWPKDAPEYQSPLFLDCCGLVRQVLRDMRKDLGFKIGPWNQAYMYDTLPINLKEEQMKPGDLVFMSGIYTNPKSKKQRHNMTHVEIWLGEGEKTIGARWNNGKVKVFDSYRFSAKSFHSEKYYFKSIDTWLMGICKSYCPQHPWKRTKYKPNKKSVFHPTSSSSSPEQQDEAANGDDDVDRPRTCVFDLGDSPSPSECSANQQNLEREIIEVDSETLTLASAAEGSDREFESDSELPDEVSGYISCSSDEESTEIPQGGHWSLYDQLYCPESSSPSFAEYSMADSYTEPNTDIHTIHSSRSSGTLLLEPQKPNPSNRSSSLPEFHGIDEEYHTSEITPFGGVKTAWNSSQVDVLGSGQGPENIKDYEGHIQQNGQELLPLLSDDTQLESQLVDACLPNCDLMSVSDSASTLDFYLDPCYCVAECDSETCDYTAEQLNDTSSSLYIPKVSILGDGDKSNEFETFDHLSDSSSEFEFHLAEGRADISEPLDIRNASDIHEHQPKDHLVVSSSETLPEYNSLDVSDVWQTPPSDADGHQSSDNSGQNGASTNQSGNSDPSKGEGRGNNSDGTGPPHRGGGKKTPGGKPTKLPTCSLANNMTPSFYIGGGNGVALVEAPLLALGWKRTADKYDERFRLKWVECKSRINYSAFREGDQLVNHIANCQMLTNKMGLLNSLQEYERVTLSTKGRLPRLKMSEFVPETYRLDNRDDRETFLQVYKENEIWISKPTGMNQGKGIFLLRSQEEIDKLLSERDARQQQSKPSRPLMSRIVQRYIHNPLLLDERKFDIRAYMLIASTVPYLVLYHKGYVRLSCHKYDGEDTNLTTHLTNQFIQKKVPNYGDVKEDTAWSMDKFNDYINEKVAPEKGIEQDWVYNTLTRQMQRIMLHCFNSVKHKLQCKVGYFDLYGLDFMVDQEMKIWLIEININPCLATNCSALKEVIPGMVEETIHLCLESFEKSRKNQPLMPLSSLKKFAVLHCGSSPYSVGHRQTRSVSPAKDNSQEKSRSTQSVNNPRQSRSPSRSVPRVAITQTPVVTQSQNQTRKSEFSTILNPQVTGGGAKTTTSAKLSRASRNSGSSNTSSSLTKSVNGTGNTNSGIAGTDKTDKTTKPTSNTAASSGENGNHGTEKANNAPVSAMSANTGSGNGSSGNSRTANSTDVKAPRTSKSADAKTSPKSESTPSRNNNNNNSGSTASSSTKAGITNGRSTSGTDKTAKTNNSTHTSKTADVKTIPKTDTTTKPQQGSGEKPVNKNNNTSYQKPKASSPGKTEADKGSKTDKSSKPTTANPSLPKSESSGKDMKMALKTTKTESKPESVPRKDIKVSEGRSVKQMVPSSQSPSPRGSGGEDVKLKMTHAKGSGSRKNRPRADTGN
ncbi:uncharacterized protein [Haliotis asinina]|uniref:uncharacterized protein n=1 Tax=Haliotis asinina TaxID=109174 RepID=UPI003531EE8E